MSELPEIELLRRDLEREVAGRKIKGVDVPGAGLVKHPKKAGFIKELAGCKVTSVVRAGLLLRFKLDDGRSLVLSLGERSRLTRNQPKDANATGTAMIISFTQGPQLRLVDPKKQAAAELVTADEFTDRHPELGRLGLDSVDEPIAWTDFAGRLVRREGKLKSVLMDPTFLVGVGPMYSDEILFHAGLRYDRDPSRLTNQEIRRLYRAVVETVHEAVKYGGTSLGPDGWVGLSGKPGEYAQYLAVYKRDGEMSPRARGPIVKTRFGGGYTYYCEQTQV
ncbi:MAG: Fpg/Nei family DNA glycosylase [Actinomycetes bacterium]